MSKIAGWVLAAFLVLLAFAVWFMGGGESTVRENVLLSLLITFASAMVSWVITHEYAKISEQRSLEKLDQTHKENLQTFGRKAAEKVFNLSNELNRLARYLEESLQDELSSQDPAVEMRIRDERLVGAIHLVATLRSVNDTSLSDWEGVIGEVIDRRRAADEAREQDLKQLVERIELVSEQSERGDALSRDVKDLKSEIRSLATQISGYPIVQRRRSVTAPCPICGTEKTVPATKSGKLRIRGVQCSRCQSKLVSRIRINGEPYFEIRRESEGLVSCPACGDTNVVALDNIPGAFKAESCRGCDAQLRLTRGADFKINVRVVEKKYTGENNTHPSEQLVEQVRLLLPDQPWPTGIHAEVAQKLEVPNKLVSRAIRELIDKGVFSEQVNGVVLSPDAQVDE